MTRRIIAEEWSRAVSLGKDSIVWADEIPWHRLGTKLPEAFTAAAAALQRGGLDSTVEKVGFQTVGGAAVPSGRSTGLKRWCGTSAYTQNGV